MSSIEIGNHTMNQGLLKLPKITRETQSIGLLILIFAVCYALFYPHMYTSLDESANYGMAYVLRHGTIYPARAGFDLSMSAPGPHGPVYRFPIGFPLVLAVASFLGPWALFLVNPSFHILGTLAFWRLTRLFKLPPMLTALYLFFPAFILYSRTLFSDPFAASLTTIALWLIATGGSPRMFVAGLCLGFAALSRSTMVIVAAMFWIYVLGEEIRSKPKLAIWQWRTVSLSLGLLPLAVVGLIYNYFTTGNMLKSTYSAMDLTLANFVTFGPMYATSLIALYPGMLIAPFVYRGRFWPVVLCATTAVFLVASSYYESTFGDNKVETLLACFRQILPVVPLYLLAYCGMISSLLPRLASHRLVIPAATLLLAALSFFIAFEHQHKLKQMVSVEQAIRTTLPAASVVYGNKDIFKLHQPMWDSMIYRDVMELKSNQLTSDLQTRPCYVVLYLRSRGVAHEDKQNRVILREVKDRLVLGNGPSSSDKMLQFYRILGQKVPESSSKPSSS